MSLPPFDALSWPLEGRWLVEASAGTGKTWTLAQLYVRMVVERNRPVEQILVITYTDAAAAELRDRLRNRLAEALVAVERQVAGAALPEDPALVRLVERWSEGLAGPEGPAQDPLHLATQRLAAAIQGFDRAAISTIHGFCRRALQEHAFESGFGFDPELMASGDGVVERVLYDLWTAALHDADPAFVAWVADRVWSTTRRKARRVVQLGLSPHPPRCLPAEPPPVDEGATARWREALAGFLPTWRAGRAVVAALPKELHGTYYKPDQVARYVAAIDLLVAETSCPVPDEELIEALQRLSRTWMTEKAGKRTQLVPTDPVLDAIEALHEAALALLEAWKVQELRLLHHFATSARVALDRARPTPTTLFFDDLLIRLDQALAHSSTLPAALRRRYPAVMVDEYQDTDPVQTRIVEAIHPDDEGTLFLVGDPKQAIYGFRGADLHTYLGVAARLRERTASLARSFRSDEPLLSALERLYVDNGRAFAGADIAWEPIEAHHQEARVHDADGAPPAPLQVLFVPNQSDEKVQIASAVAEDVVHVLRQGWTVLDGEEHRPVRPGDLAVLVARNETGESVVAALAERGVPAVQRGGDFIFQVVEARAMLTLLDAMLAPADVSRLRALHLSCLIGHDAAAVAELDEDERLLQRALDRLAGWRTVWETRGFYRAFRTLMREEGLVARLIKTRGGERALTNLRHLAELMHEAESVRRLGLLELRRWLARQIEDKSSGQDGRELRLEADSLAVQVVTMHTSKGLEYPIVWVAEAHYQGRPSDPPVFHQGDGLVMDLGAEEASRQAAQGENRQERARLTYVALTRARHLCIATWGLFGGKKRNAAWRTSPIGGLLQLPGEHGDATSDEELWAITEQRVASLPGLALRRASGELTSWQQPEEPAFPRPARHPARNVGFDQRITSFTGLVAAAPPEDDGQDNDALVQHAPVLDVPSELPLALFPRGADAGTVVHAVLERLDFADPTGPAAASWISYQLVAGGIPLDPNADLLRWGLDEVLRTEIDPGFSLSHLSRADRIDEMGFVLATGEVSGSDLARALEVHEPELGARYAQRLRRLEVRLDRSSLKGYIDLVYRRNGRWYVVDYKTNHLGGAPDDYTPDRLLQVMVDHDYLLQAALYTLAVHRFLRARMPGYDYDRHMGGARYLFLRGMRPSTGAARGVFAMRPSRGWIESWDRIIGGGST